MLLTISFLFPFFFIFFFETFARKGQNTERSSLFESTSITTNQEWSSRWFLHLHFFLYFHLTLFSRYLPLIAYISIKRTKCPRISCRRPSSSSCYSKERGKKRPLRHRVHPRAFSLAVIEIPALFTLLPSRKKSRKYIYIYRLAILLARSTVPIDQSNTMTIDAGLRSMERISRTAPLCTCTELIQQTSALLHIFNSHARWKLGKSSPSGEKCQIKSFCDSKSFFKPI